MVLGLLLAFAVPVDSPRTVLVVHGGLGVPTAAELAQHGRTRAELERDLARALAAGYAKIAAGKPSLDAVEAAIRVLEDSELFNAGKGAVLNRDGRAELDAAIMEGGMAGRGPGKGDPRKRAGAVAAVQHVKNPISAARAILEMPGQKHVLLVGPGAEAYVLEPDLRARFGLERVENTYFWTDRRLRELRTAPANAAPPGNGRFDTVGAVAAGSDGHVAAGTSTGGLSGKFSGRVGDAPLIGSGTYADDRACGVSCTGTGEVFIRHAVAHEVVARMVHAKQGLEEAAAGVVADLPDEPGGVGGLIALAPSGRHAFAMSAASAGMARGFATADGKCYVMVGKDDPPKPVAP